MRAAAKCGDPCHKGAGGASAAAAGDIAAWLAQPHGRSLGDIMSERPKSAEKARRQRRLGAALRQNLRRRKAQAKGRAAAGAAGTAKPHDSAGIGADKPQS